MKEFFYVIGEAAPTMFVFVVVGLIYFTPSIIGSKHKNASSIFVLNLFLGWTFLGWVIALVWALKKD